eukprot:4961007-Pyramimonas_sp.AAC.1
MRRETHTAGRDCGGRTKTELRTGISVVDVAASLFDEKANQRIMDVSTEELGECNPALAEQRPVRCVQLDSTPWPGGPRAPGATADPRRSMGDEADTQHDFTPAEH